jgi:hypothetical protein
MTEMVFLGKDPLFSQMGQVAMPLEVVAEHTKA